MQDTHTVALVHYCDDVASLLVSIEAISPDERCDLLVVSEADAYPPIEPELVQAAWRPRGDVHALTAAESDDDVAALNLGLQWCADHDYRYVARLLRGDRSTPGRLTAQSAFLDAHPAVVAVGGSVAMVDSRDAAGFVVQPPTEHEAIMAALRLGNPTTDGALMFRTSAVLAVGGYLSGYPGAADYALLWRLTERGQLANLPEVVIERRIGHRGVPIAVRETELRSRMRVQRDHLDGSWRARYGIVRTAGLMAVPQSALVRAKRVLMRDDAAAKPMPDSPQTRRSEAPPVPQSPGQAARIALVAAVDEPADLGELAQVAIAFCERGDSVRLIATADPAADAAEADWDAAFALSGRPPSVPGVPTMAITDAAGAPVTLSAIVVDAVSRNEPWIEVQIRDGLGSVLAVGAVSTLRSVAATREQMLRVAGPLLVVAARALPLPAAVADDFWDTVGGASTGAARGADAAGSVRFVGRLARRVLTTRQWQLARLPVETWRPSDGLGLPLRWRTAPNDNFWADPHLVVDEGRVWMLVEELDMAVGRGAIRLLEVIGDDVAPHGIVLRTRHHLSYPQTYRTADGWLGTVETCAAHNPIYTFDRPGAPWRPADHLPPLPPHLADPVLLLADGQVVGVLGTDARVDPDSVVVRFTLDSGTGTWRRDDDAVRVSVINGRGGGTLDVHRGLRATQDCAGVYGRALEIIAYPETDPPDVRWRLDGHEHNPGPDVDGQHAGGMHTLTWAGGAGPDRDETVAWCDGWRIRVTPRGWLLDLRERQHLDECEG